MPTRGHITVWVIFRCVRDYFWQYSSAQVRVGGKSSPRTQPSLPRPSPSSPSALPEELVKMPLQGHLLPPSDEMIKKYQSLQGWCREGENIVATLPPGGIAFSQQPQVGERGELRFLARVASRIRNKDLLFLLPSLFSSVSGCLCIFFLFFFPLFFFYLTLWGYKSQ